MRKKNCLLFLTILIGISPSIAVGQLAYTSIPITAFHTWKILIPRDPMANRFYLLGRLNSHVASARALVDAHTMISAIGTSKTTSIPASLLEGRDNRFTEVIVFPKSAFNQSAHSVTFEFQYTDGKLTRHTLKHKHLAALLNAFH